MLEWSLSARGPISGKAWSSRQDASDEVVCWKRGAEIEGHIRPGCYFWLVYDVYAALGNNLRAQHHHLNILTLKTYCLDSATTYGMVLLSRN